MLIARNVIFSFIILSSCRNPTVVCSQFEEVFPTNQPVGKDYDDSMAIMNTLEKILNEDSFCIKALLLHGDLNLAKDNFILAKQDYFRASIISPSNVYALYKLAAVYHFTDNYDTSVLFINRAVFLKSKGDLIVDDRLKNSGFEGRNNAFDIPATELLFLRAMNYYLSGNMTNAYDDFSFCINNNYLVVQSLEIRGQIYLKMKDKESACNDFKRADSLGSEIAKGFLTQYCN